MIVKMNEIVLDMAEVESIEWKHDEDEQYSVRFHMKSGKMFTRIVHKNQLDNLIDEFKEE